MGGRLGPEKIKLGKKCEGCVAIGDFSSQTRQRPQSAFNPSVAASMPALLQLWQCMAWPSPQLRWKINHYRPSTWNTCKKLPHPKRALITPKEICHLVCLLLYYSSSNHLSGHWRSRWSPTCCATETCWGSWQPVWLLYSWNWWAIWSSKNIFLFAKWYLQSCSDEHVHVAEEQAHPQHGGHRHIFPGQASPKTVSFSRIDVTLLEEPLLLVNRLWANIDEKVPSVRKC